MEDTSPSAEDQLSTSDLAARITELAGHLNSANRRWLRLIAEFDRRQGWSDGCTRSCAHWLGWKCGLDMGAAREKVRVASPATEEVLLNIALHGTTHHVETLVRQFRRAREQEELSREFRQHAGRRCTYYHDADGSLVVRLQLPAEGGALLLQALEAAVRDVPLPDDCKDQLHVSAETRRPPLVGEVQTLSARRADAVVVLAESFLKHGSVALNGGERHQIVVHVDAESLRSGEAGRCELEDGPAVPVETARRLACDSSVVTIIEDARGEPLDVGRKTRSIPPALRRALKSRDQGCVFPGCTHKRYVDGHHVQHWAEGGATKLSNLVSLCRFHHRAVHEGGIRIQRLDDGAWRFVLGNGQSLESCSPGRSFALGDWHNLVAADEGRGIPIDAHTAATRWRGERMDYGIAIDSLLFRERRAATIAPNRAPRCDSAP